MRTVRRLLLSMVVVASCGFAFAQGDAPANDPQAPDTFHVRLDTSAGPVERDIVIGLANERMAEIRSGLSEGDEVVLNPKVLVGEQVKVRTSGDPDRQSGGEGKKGKGKGGAGKSDGPKGPATPERC